MFSWNVWTPATSYLYRLPVFTYDHDDLSWADGRHILAKPTLTGAMGAHANRAMLAMCDRDYAAGFDVFANLAAASRSLAVFRALMDPRLILLTARRSMPAFIPDGKKPASSA